MGVVVQFDYASWALQFPQFTGLGQTQVTTLILPIADKFNRNDGGGPVRDAALQTQLLNLMVAHVAWKMFGPDGSGNANSGGLVGPITDATEGSVSVSSDIPVTANSYWYNSTPFGAMWWTLTAPFRTMRYVPAPRRVFSPWPNQ